MTGKVTYSLIIPSDPRHLSLTRAFVESVGCGRGLDRTLVHRLVLAAGEAFSNILRHAHRDRPEAAVEMHLCLDGEAATLVFLDQGPPFDITQVPVLDPREEMRLGGRGVYMMRALMDELSCMPRSPSEKGNRLRMVKYLKEEAGEPEAK